MTSLSVEVDRRTVELERSDYDDRTVQFVVQITTVGRAEKTGDRVPDDQTSSWLEFLKFGLRFRTACLNIP